MVMVFIEHENHLQELITMIGIGLSSMRLILDEITSIINAYAVSVVIIFNKVVVIVKDLFR